MGQESEQKIREAAFAGFQVNDELMAVTNEGCMVQHCLPAHRGEEITAEVFEAHADEIFDEAENRLHAQKAILVKLMADSVVFHCTKTILIFLSERLAEQNHPHQRI